MPVTHAIHAARATRTLVIGAMSALALAACGGDGGPGPEIPAGVISLAVGEGRTLTSAQAATIEIAGSGGADFVLIPFHGSTVPTATVALEFSGTDLTGVAGSTPQLAPASDPAFSIERTATLRSRDTLRARFDARLRRLERDFFAPRMAAARAALRLRASKSVSGSGSLAAVLPAVGDQLTFNVNADPGEQQTCHIPDLRTGTVRAVTQRAIIVGDNQNPAGGFTDAEYLSIAQQFDTFVYPLDVLNFGAPADMDNNEGHVIIFYTRAVNEMTPPQSESVIGGFFHPRDLFPKGPGNPNLGACPTSNEAEMFYMLVPDPNGEVNGNVREKEPVLEGTVAVIGHEFQHLINASRRLYVNDVFEFEDVWLNEGLSHIAEELLFYSASGLAPRQNITFNQLVSSQAMVDAVNAYQIDNFARLLEYVENPETNSPFDDGDELATRGAAWQLLRYAADRSTRPQQAIWQALVNSRTVGIANFTAELGDFMPLVRDWTVAQYTDDVIAQTVAIRQHPSWHFRSILPRIINQQNPPAYPLKTRTLGSGTPVSLTLNAGGAAYLRFGVGAGATGKITPTSAGGPPPSTVSFTLVRTR
jgi:hypothetical protein